MNWVLFTFRPSGSGGTRWGVAGKFIRREDARRAAWAAQDDTGVYASLLVEFDSDGGDRPIRYSGPINGDDMNSPYMPYQQFCYFRFEASDLCNQIANLSRDLAVTPQGFDPDRVIEFQE